MTTRDPLTGSLSPSERAEPLVLHELLDGGVVRIILNRPETRNAQNTDLLYALNDAFDHAARDDAVKVIVLAASGPHFSSGHDMRERGGDVERVNAAMLEHRTVGTWASFRQPGADGYMSREMEIYFGFCERWRNLPKPTIAQVHGKAIIGGLMLIWPCDLIVASEDATFLDNAVQMGIGSGEFFQHVFELGPRKAKELLFTAEPITAAEGYRLGMINHVVSRAELESFTLALARKIARYPAFALKLAKESVNASVDAQGRLQGMRTAFALHQLAHWHNHALYGRIVDPSYLTNTFGDKMKDENP